MKWTLIPPPALARSTTGGAINLHSTRSTVFVTWPVNDDNRHNPRKSWDSCNCLPSGGTTRTQPILLAPSSISRNRRLLLRRATSPLADAPIKNKDHSGAHMLCSNISSGWSLMPINCSSIATNFALATPGEISSTAWTVVMSSSSDSWTKKHMTLEDVRSHEPEMDLMHVKPRQRPLLNVSSNPSGNENGSLMPIKVASPVVTSKARRLLKEHGASEGSPPSSTKSEAPSVAKVYGQKSIGLNTHSTAPSNGFTRKTRLSLVSTRTSQTRHLTSDTSASNSV
mmetsp:Transcript_48656/g.139892  ORF Transcript_48656/g.139892 Transcript_48656/m.139892 type:complete len:283 (-) Transcript_48656:332-1180(-)